MVATLGIFTTLLLTSLFTRELIVRDFYLLFTLFMLLLSSFTFNLTNMSEDIYNIAKLNPLRWLFECSMIWKYQDYPDGQYMPNSDPTKAGKNGKFFSRHTLSFQKNILCSIFRLLMTLRILDDLWLHRNGQ